VFLLPLAIVLAVNAVVTAITVAQAQAIIGRAHLRGDGAAGHLELVRHALRHAESPAVRRRMDVLRDGDAPAALQSLERILSWNEVRHSTILYPIVQLLFLYDIHLAAALETWQERHGERAPRWFAALGEIEALSALATLAHDNPEWAYPRIGGDTIFRARGLGHPLIAPAVRVGNDVEVGPPGTLLLITGSNLAGKSTLLRAIGCNVLLANAGAPACAAELTLPRVRLYTSINVRDSLEDGLSLFATELKRVRFIVDAAKESEQAPVLYLLDELLRGTNTEERRIAVASVLRHLLRAGAIGAIATHDLPIVEEAGVREAAVPVHFREEFIAADGRPGMRFDYRLRPGLATSTNALALLRIMGLGFEE
jgi:DNA mismatch repair ATPase MutS